MQQPRPAEVSTEPGNDLNMSAMVDPPDGRLQLLPDACLKMDFVAAGQRAGGDLFTAHQPSAAAARPAVADHVRGAPGVGERPGGVALTPASAGDSVRGHRAEDSGREAL